MKSLCASGAKGRDAFGIKSREESSLVKNIKGKRLGKTLTAQTLTPLSAEFINFAGEVIIQARKKRMVTLAMLEKNACPLKIDALFFKSYPVLIDLMRQCAL